MLTLAVNPTELQYGNSHFLWGLRNTYNTELQAHGKETESFDDTTIEMAGEDVHHAGKKPPKKPIINTAV